MKKDVMQAIAETGILPVINITDIDTAKPLAKAILDGGLSALEITLRSEVSLQAIREITSAYPDLKILAGTILTVENAQAALDAGAEGLVMPGYDDEIVDFAISKSIPIVPGCITAADIQTAMGNREVALAEMKKRAEEYKAGNTQVTAAPAAPKAKAGGFNF